MATRICPNCGAQYVATVRRCIDCDIVLVDEPSADDEVVTSATTSTPIGDGDQIGYELEGWGNQLKVTLEGMLDNAGIPRAWEAGALVVSAAHEEVVDDLIATVEGEVVELDDDVPRVALEIEELDPESQDALDARLLAESIAHSWDEDGVLLVAEADEDRVLAIIDDVLEEPPDTGDGLAAMEALSAVYVALDKLVKSPLDAKLGARFADAAAELDVQDVPFGFAGEDWAVLVADTDALVARLARERGTDGEEAEADGDGAEVDGDAEADHDQDPAERSDATDATDGEDEGDDRDEDGDEADEAGEAEVDDAGPSDDEPLAEVVRALRNRVAELV